MISNKKLGLIGAIIFLSALFLLPPVAFGYGSSFGTAETKSSNMTYAEMLQSGDNFAYYKVSKVTGEYLQVSISWTSSSFDLDVKIYDPSQTYVTGDISGGTSDSCGCSITTSGDWYIQILRWTGTGDVYFTLTISPSRPIPGFELLYVLFSIVVLLGIVAFFKRHKLIVN